MISIRPVVNEFHPRSSPFFPCYKSIINAKANIRFEYDANGWLVKEELTSLDYNYAKASADQIALVAEYTYKFA